VTLPKDPCPECGQPKVARSTRCWGCHVAVKRAEALSPDERRARNAASMAARRVADPEKARRESREQYKRNGRKHNLKWKFGITPEQLADMRAAQADCCYLCNEPLQKGRIHIDHDRSCCRGDRSCGTCIRGLACQLCNQGIGQFGDDPERMRRVADNLEMATRRLQSTSRPRALAQ